MKSLKYRIIASVFACSVAMVGCEDYLEEENNSYLSLENIDADMFDQLVAYTYEISRETTTYYTPNVYYTLEDLGTDIVTRGGAITGTDELNDYVNLTSLNSSIGYYWTNQYKIIAAANVVIDNSEGIADLSADDLAVGLGEVKFFRAMAYFKLAENYGGVPLVLNQITVAERDFTRASEEAVYDQILMDLEDALAGVPEEPDTFGRVSKDAVRHFISKVLLTRGYKSYGSDADFSQAATLAETVIANHPLEDSFSELVSIDNQRNDEVIFSYLFGSNSVSRGWGNSRHMMYKFRFFDYPGLTRTVKGLGPMPTPFYYSLFEEEDERAEATFTRVIDATEEYTATVNGSSVTVSAGDTAIYFPKTAWTQAEIDAVPYAVINPGTYFQNDGVTTVHYPMFQKFDDPAAPFAQPDVSVQGERDMVLMRGGEAYLFAAEAYLQLGNTAEAATLLTTLRARAGITEEVTATEVDIDFILDERARELAGEANRWMDLKRTGRLIDRVLENNPHAALNNALQEKHLLRPIPQTEIDNSGGSIEQNPGY
ncbi:Starch-binding associating with outer membrane [Pustulibacterium marinum]|uniref:Starch-binding associating with outer membrane n=1 Tax=Pustulibacterium marinum TaxID=1224947 RepID=A0A1I7IAS3_9FLAO|nr:RagB/SusD family nutrient uptake outer membrane protein [Pustulibacterium marinum]SFU69964.1 Starch-binding associating with outer membrane [Pustulibacterium marinum]